MEIFSGMHHQMKSAHIFVKHRLVRVPEMNMYKGGFGKRVKEINLKHWRNG